MMQGAVFCLRFVHKHKRLAFAGCLTLLVACVFFSLQLIAREDIRVLLPEGEDSIPRQLVYLQKAPFLQTLTITVGGEGQDAIAAANSVASHLREAGVPILEAVSGEGFTPASLARTSSLWPSLLPPALIREWGDNLNDAAIRAALEKDRAQLIGPVGFIMRDVINADPLRLHERVFPSLENMRHSAGFFIKDGHVIDSSGAYSMVLIRPQAAMTDTLAASSIMANISRALQTLPRPTEAYVSGSYRHSEANAAVIKADLHRILPISILCLAVLFAFFLRTRQALIIFAVPLASLCIAATVTAHVWGSISGLVLGFGSVVLGITADYAIHAYYSVSSAHDAEEGVTHLFSPLLGGLMTTGAAFATLLLSAIPAIRQMASMGLAGIIAAALFSLFILPLLIRPGSLAHTPLAQKHSSSVRALPAFALTIALALFSFFGVKGLHFDGDLRNLAYLSAEIAADDERTRAIWQMPSEGSFVVVEGENSPEGHAAMADTNEAIYNILLRAGITPSSIAPLWPSPKRQEESRQAWNDLWQERGEAIRASLAAAAAKTGFAPGAFQPFFSLLEHEPAPVDRHSLTSAGLSFFLSMFMAENNEQSLIYTIIPQGITLHENVRDEISRAGGQYVSGTLFRSAMAESIGQDIFRFCFVTFAVVLLVVAAIFRSPARCTAVCLPMFAALAGSISFYYLHGATVTMFHAVALPLVIALSVDYGIFMQAVMEGRMDALGKKAILLSALTTLSGFGCLLLAKHPALFSLGVTVTGGIGMAMLTALFIQPRLFVRKAPPAEAP